MKISELKEFLTILEKYTDSDFLEVDTAHDTLYMGNLEDDAMERMSEEDKKRIEELGWSVDDVDGIGWMCNV